MKRNHMKKQFLTTYSMRMTKPFGKRGTAQPVRFIRLNRFVCYVTTRNFHPAMVAAARDIIW